MVGLELLTETGKLAGDLIIGRLADRGHAARYFLVGSSIAEQHYLLWFETHKASCEVRYRSQLSEQVGIAIARQG